MPKFVFLATDLALYGLLVVIALYVWNALRTPTLRQTWRSVLHDPAAMSAGVVLAIFLVIAMLDSVHFRPLLPPAPGAAADAAPAYSTRTLSVLDALLSGPRDAAKRPTRCRWERTSTRRSRCWSTASRCATIRGSISAAGTS